MNSCGKMSVLLAGLIAACSGQMQGADCDITLTSSSPGAPKLCMPQYPKAPPTFLPNHAHSIGTSPYIFYGADANGVMHNATFDPASITRLYGFELNKFCYEREGSASRGYVALAYDPLAPPSPPVAPIALYANEATAPRGCAAISPLPTLEQTTCVDLIAVWILLIIYLFYALAMVCEEFLVPAINILCVKTGIPDDVAGATLLAAGCNSPEFFASIIGIFIADSTVGVGTVIGSAPFNLCCITGGAALALGGSLWLDPWLMGRELLGLCVSFLLFLIFMADELVQWWEALIMVLFYWYTAQA
jgi:hypothetical protein